MSDLITRLEALTGPNFEIEQEIGRLMNPNATRLSVFPAYTSSIDAAMTLVPEGWDYCITPRNGVWVRQSEHFPTIHGNAATPALALCIASLKAAGYE